MKIEAPSVFKKWLMNYKSSANYFMASEGDEYGLFLLARDAYLKGIEDEKENKTETKKLPDQT